MSTADRDDFEELTDDDLTDDDDLLDDDGLEDDDDLQGDDHADALSDESDDEEILSRDPDEYSDQPHMGSVPRVLGEDEYMPDTQGEDPVYAELGDEGQGDLAPEDL